MSLLVDGALVVTMDEARRVVPDGAILVQDGGVAEVGRAAELRERHPAAERLDGRGLVALPGLVNAHVHLTGPSLLPGIEPGSSPVAEHFPRWVLPPHAHSDADDERAAARLVALQMLRAGTTAFLEAGVTRFPQAVLEGLAGLGIRGALGAWAADEWPMPPPLGQSTEEALGALDAALALTPPVDRLEVRPHLVGHTGCSDALMRAAAQRARERGQTWTFHMSAMADDGEAYRGRTGEAPLVHLAREGVLDERAVVAHAIHLSDGEADALAEAGASVAFCPQAALRLQTGVTRVGRHPELPHVALGTDTQNASNHLDVLRAAAAAVDLYGEAREDRTVLTAERALWWATRGGARALGWEDRVGSLEPGKRADLVLVDPVAPVHHVANALVHGAPRVVHVLVDGDLVVRDGRLPAAPEILAEAGEAAGRVAARAGLPLATGWLAHAQGVRIADT